MLNTFTPK